MDEISKVPRGYIMTSGQGPMIHDGKGYFYELDSDEGREIAEDLDASRSL